MRRQTGLCMAQGRFTGPRTQSDHSGGDPQGALTLRKGRGRGGRPKAQAKKEGSGKNSVQKAGGNRIVGNIKFMAMKARESMKAT